MRFVLSLLLVLVGTVAHADGITSESIFQYKNALKAHKKSGNPLVVVCGADWCGPCRTYKATTLTEIATRIKAGKLKMHLAIVDVDKQPKLKNEIFGDDKFGVPYTVIYRSKSGGGYRRSFFYGPASVDFVIKNAFDKSDASK